MYPRDGRLLSYLHLTQAESFLEKGLDRQAVEELLQTESFGGASPKPSPRSRAATKLLESEAIGQKSLDLEDGKCRKESEQARATGKLFRRFRSPSSMRVSMRGTRRLSALETCFQNRDENLLFHKVESHQEPGTRKLRN
jgi:hypothetical protein